MTNQTRTRTRTRSLVFTGRLAHNGVYDTIAGDPVYKTVAHYSVKLTWYSWVNFEAGALGYANSNKLVQLFPHTIIPETVRHLTVPATGGKWPVESTVETFLANLSRSHLHKVVHLRIDFIE